MTTRATRALPPQPPAADPAPGGKSGHLRRCIAVGPDTFAAEHWGRAPLLTRRARLPSGFGDLLDLDTADELLSRRGLRTPFLRVARDGEVVGSAQFTGSGGAGAQVADQVRDDRVADLFASGATIVLQALHRCWPPLIDFARGLAGELGHPVQANAYLTPPSSRGFTAHYDVHDVFVLQLAGAKDWTVHAPVHPDPLRDQPWTTHAEQVARAAAHIEPVLDITLEPGDALYLPRGYLHAARSHGATSAHLTIGIHTVTRFALVDALLDALRARLADSPELRAALPMGVDLADQDRLAPHLHAVAEHLAAALPTVADADVAAGMGEGMAGGMGEGLAEEAARRVHDRVWAGARPEPLGPIAQATFAAAVGPDSTVRRRGGLRCSLRTEDNQVVLERPGHALTLPLATLPAVRRLLGGADTLVGSLPGLDGEDRLVLVRRLLREGVIVPVGAP